MPAVLHIYRFTKGSTMKKLFSTFASTMFAFSVAGCNAGPLDKAEELLKEQHAYMCQMESRTASNSEKADAQRKYMEVSNKIGQVKMEIMSDQKAQVKFQTMSSKIGKMPCTDASSKADAKAASAKSKDLIKDLGKHLCAYSKTTDGMEQAKIMLEADKVRKQLKDSIASLKNAGEKSKADDLSDEVRALEMNQKSGC